MSVVKEIDWVKAKCPQCGKGNWLILEVMAWVRCGLHGFLVAELEEDLQLVEGSRAECLACLWKGKAAEVPGLIKERDE